MSKEEFYLKHKDGFYLGPLDYTSAVRLWNENVAFVGIVEKVPPGSKVADPIDGIVKVKA